MSMAEARAALNGILQPGERVLRESEINQSVPIARGRIVLTDRRIIILKTPRGMAKLLAGEGSIDIRLEHVKNVEFFPGGPIAFLDNERNMLVIESRAGTFSVHFHGSGGRQEGSVWPQLILDAQSAAQRAASGVGGASPGQSEDLATQLKRLAEMHAAGHLSDVEFASAKAKLLGT